MLLCICRVLFSHILPVSSFIGQIPKLEKKNELGDLRKSVFITGSRLITIWMVL